MKEAEERVKECGNDDTDANDEVTLMTMAIEPPPPKNLANNIIRSYCSVHVYDTNNTQPYSTHVEFWDFGRFTFFIFCRVPLHHHR